MSYAYTAQKRKNFKTGESLFYAAPAPTTPVSINQLASEISEKCTATRADILAVLSELQNQIINALLAGNTIRLGMVGSFRATVTATSVELKDNVSVDLIKRVNCKFVASSWIKNRLQTKRLNFKRMI